MYGRFAGRSQAGFAAELDPEQQILLSSGSRSAQPELLARPWTVCPSRDKPGLCVSVGWTVRQTLQCLFYPLAYLDYLETRAPLQHLPWSPQGESNPIHHPSPSPVVVLAVSL